MRPRRAVAIAALVAYGYWVTSLRPFSTVATVAVVGAGAIAIGWGVTHRRPRGTPRETTAEPTQGEAERGVEPGLTVRRGLAGWLLLAAMLAAWQFAAYLQEPRSEHPTLSSLANAALESNAVRALACAAWLLLAVRLAEQ